MLLPISEVAIAHNNVPGGIPIVEVATFDQEIRKFGLLNTACHAISTAPFSLLR